ncbi:hypothetical protein MXX25_07710 [Klebsiella pneumoniae]|jgi:hypothetical protein|uniref:Ead/Ea22-like family protein n=1 Tax=Klebsiella pneumoniae TaxID=573 RepID=A0ABD7NNY7_KLEPN|nr:hypothetical protein [Klebsiella pneumoniae]MDG0707021.1 hypothetical protein [Klebsiella pneumoniae]MDG0723880.1 hypothetical protein [Klebsiella pneumoniae]MDG0733873.1 hypothetical protein [Klebsiella pneumoniae]MDL4710523.1 hypothetical protein [Klebsiella pneumoniae]WCN43564.1 hypothetical protein PO783_06665 [Klebsiella pneumoniae]
MTDITELTSVQKNANIHRLSRLIAYAPNDELRQMAVEVEHYTDQLIEALEKAQQRNAELESFRTAYMEWSDKTAWVQTDKRFDVLKPWGKHRADVLKEYIQHLESRTVKLPKPISVLHRREFTGAHCAIYAYPEAEVNAALDDAGIKVEAE